MSLPPLKLTRSGSWQGQAKGAMLPQLFAPASVLVLT